MSKRPAFAGAGRSREGARPTTSGARMTVSPASFKGKVHCAARKPDGAGCQAWPAQGTPYCVGHGRALGVITIGDSE